MSERPTPETDALAETLIPLAENITASNAQNVIKQILIEILTKTTTLERERDEAREKNEKLHDIAKRAINYLDQSYRDGFSDEVSDLRYELEQLKEETK